MSDVFVTTHKLLLATAEQCMSATRKVIADPDILVNGEVDADLLIKKLADELPASNAWLLHRCYGKAVYEAVLLEAALTTNLLTEVNGRLLLKILN